MPASGKMLKNKQQAANRAAGLGDEKGRLPSKPPKIEVMVRCSICGIEIRATKTNTEAKAHTESRHSPATFATCFPSAFDPSAPGSSGGESSASVPVKKVAVDKKK